MLTEDCAAIPKEKAIYYYIYLGHGQCTMPEG